jgi:hypothetical protein
MAGRTGHRCPTGGQRHQRDVRQSRRDRARARGAARQTASEFWLHPWLLKPAVSNRRKSSETNIWPLMDRRSDSATTRPGCSSNSYMPDKIRLTIHQRNGNFGVVCCATPGSSMRCPEDIPDPGGETHHPPTLGCFTRSVALYSIPRGSRQKVSPSMGIRRSLAFDAGQRDTRQDIPLGEAKDDDEWGRGERRGRHQEAPLGRVLGPKGKQPQRKWVLTAVR